MKQTVVIVDDSLTVRMDLADAFREAGFLAVPCATVAEAREALSDAQARIFILDVLLPDGDGVDLLQEIRRSPSGDSAVIVMLSSEAEVKDRIRGLQTGADEYVGKPYDAGYLVAKVQELIQIRQPSGIGDTTVLVIDDSVTFREHLRAAFESAGHRVLTASTGEEGLRIAGAQRPNAVVVDGMLPGIDGATVIRHIRLDAALRDVPCLLLTASEDKSAELRALDAGADTFVRKDGDLEVILAKLAAVLRRTTARAIGDEETRSLLGPKKILAVDDSVTYLHELTDALKGEGYDVVHARSGEEAIALLAVQGVDCILLDLVMPGMGGHETCRRIKAAPIVRDIPLIMLTALEEREALIQGLVAGADDYISKSSDFDVLKARVRAQIRHKQFGDENRRIREELLRKEFDATEALAAHELARAKAALVVRREADEKVQAQLGRLNLLHQITRAIGERQGLSSIFLVVLERLEDSLPVDFGCICLYEPGAETLTVMSVGAKSQALALELGLSAQARIEIDENGLSRCVNGHLVCELDVRDVSFPFPQRLARVGLRSLVAAPLLVESRVFGVLITARREAGAFSSGECEFLRQLSEHVALAAHQSQLYTALQQAYDDLRQSQQVVMQQERLRALGQMASGIAHDINNAMSPAALYAESLLEQEKNLSPEGRKYLEIIQRAIEDTAQTVDRMREFSREREPQLTLVPVDLNQLVQQVTELARARWSDMPQQRGIVIELRLDLAADLALVLGVESEIREALLNLVFNAVDAMPKGGTLTVRTRHAGASVAEGSAPRAVFVEVADTGVGMNDQTRTRCTEPFFSTKGERGTGLGLAMVHGIARRHNAELEIESTVGEGSTLRLSFPAPSISPIGGGDAEAQPLISSPLRLLIVDDDPLLLRSLRDTLEGDRHVVVTADGGQAGIDTFSVAQEGAERFDLVITDLGMPYVSGSQVASFVKGASPSTPVIMLTGWGRRLVAEGDVPPNVDQVLSKPPKLRDLREAIARHVPAKQ
jgi:DNA-binding response OmpR family regulator/signal transduction histidine kinase